MSMIRTKTLRAAARILLGTLIAAYAMVSLHATARAPQGLDESRIAARMAMAMAMAAAEAVDDDHCNQQATETTALLCKYHCQSAVQTLDHPDIRLSAAADTAYLVVNMSETTVGHASMRPPAARPDEVHHGGAPPLYQSTARLRI